MLLKIRVIRIINKQLFSKSISLNILSNIRFHRSRRQLARHIEANINFDKLIYAYIDSTRKRFRIYLNIGSFLYKDEV